MFQRHVESRWLTLAPVMTKVEEHWHSAKPYFSNFRPSQKEEFKSYTSRNERYDFIMGIFDPCSNRFCHDVSVPYNKFHLWFQGDSPLIHLLFTYLKKLLVCILKRFVISREIDEESEKSMLQLDVAKKKETHLPLEKNRS